MTAPGAPYKRKLIEVALPLEAINVASAREKSIRQGHPSTLHLWWSRKPLATCRAVLFASLVDDPSSDPESFPTQKAQEDERTRLFGIIERLVQWDNTANEEVLEEARAEIRRSTKGNPPPVLDPFCGGGSIPLEAQRLGLTANAADLNPVAVLITKALVEIPPKFANRPPVHPEGRRGVGGTGAWKGAAGLAEDVRNYGGWMRAQAEARIGNLYPKVPLPREQGGGEATVIAWLWARTVTCPNPACGAEMILTSRFDLSTKRGSEAWAEPIIDRDAKTIRFEVRTGHGSPAQSPKVGRGANFRCLVCGQVALESSVRDEFRAKRDSDRLVAIVAEGRRGRIYVSPTAEQEQVARSALPVWTPDEEMNQETPNLVSGRGYGVTHWRELFTSRQLVAMTTFCDLVGEAREHVLGDAMSSGLPDDDRRLWQGGAGAAAYADAVATYLGLGVSRLADNSSALVLWSPARDQLTHTFVRQALPMSWDHAEGNAFSGSAGDLGVALGSMVRVLEGLPASVDSTVRQADASVANPAQRPALISTDPPYYDNIGYADLSDFFYIWLRRALGGVHPDLFETVLTPKTGELAAAPYRFDGNRTAADQHFESGLHSAFVRMREIADPTVPVTVYYAFKQAENDGDGDGGIGTASTGWETMLEGLLKSGFAIDGTWPMRTERTSRSNSIGTNALASSIVLVCRPLRPSAGITTRRDFIVALKRELPEALRTLQHGNVAPVDLAQASIGPGMSIFSRYAKVLEPDGSPMRVRTALALINGALDELLTEQEGEFDADTRWAIAWYEQFGLTEGPSGQAILLTQAKVTSLEGVERAGIATSAKGRVRLLGRGEYTAAWDPVTDFRLPVWEATQRLIHALLVDGESGAADLLARIGGIGDVARDLAYRLYQVAERKGLTDEARAYNALVVAWPDLIRGAEQARTRRPAQASLGLES